MHIVVLIKKLTNESITVELKNGTLIYGILQKYDKYMNLYLKNVKKSLSQKKSIYFESISIRGSMIRYIIFPNWINLDLLLIEKN